MGFPDMVTPCSMTTMPVLNVERVVQHPYDLLVPIWLFDLAMRHEVANSRSSPSPRRLVRLATTPGYTFAIDLLLVDQLALLRRRILCL